MRARLRSLARTLVGQPYEAAIGAACLSGVVEVVTGRGSTALSTVFPHWALHVLGAMAATGGCLTVGGLVVAGLVLDDVRRVVARRAEQTGQIMVSGVLVAIGIGAMTFGIDSLIPGAVDFALGVASAVRAADIAQAFRVAGRRP